MYILYFICFLLLWIPIFPILKSEQPHEDIYYLIFSELIFQGGLWLFYYRFQNLYFAFFSSFFLIIFSFCLFFQLKKESKFYFFTYPILLLQIIICIFLFWQFF